mmetsp:Transcript_89083/g.276848  ORF Transcript_89083/g.276848 Transcript_89083/m.276848 type:complete len:229 (+) Transcript_89083:100-786(+)
MRAARAISPARGVRDRARCRLHELCLLLLYAGARGPRHPSRASRSSCVPVRLAAGPGRRGPAIARQKPGNRGAGRARSHRGGRVSEPFGADGQRGRLRLAGGRGDGVAAWGGGRRCPRDDGSAPRFGPSARASLQRAHQRDLQRALQRAPQCSHVQSWLRLTLSRRGGRALNHHRHNCREGGGGPSALLLCLDAAPEGRRAPHAVREAALLGMRRPRILHRHGRTGLP